MRQIPLSEIKKDLSRFLREAEGEEIVIIRNGKPTGLLISFASEDDWLDYQLESDLRFLAASTRRERAYGKDEALGLRISSQSERN